MNKKGQFKLIRDIILSLLFLAVLISVIMYFRTGSLSFFDFLGKVKPDSHDYDGDEMQDGIDPCPCGSPLNMKNLQDSFEGIQKCIQKLEPCSDKYLEYGFETQKDSRDREVCTYRKAECMKLIEDELKK
jgi:hypothetical protein